ncbi:hypothetical protein GCM10023084_80360 [Streptomyces lacrimifluminis]|uniref:Uncharacterized protein n=1 Tax=Streptomyces lacrimifluminis TaxID=1500077 RepID=A0A917PCJ2_9ACTN|nr:hypothetical protein [Streptomyces lacrimifluminis]GGJ70641.1 hypothetical protein GCM10012282_79360 [Streptomyces lacrimifluminis]
MVSDGAGGRLGARAAAVEDAPDGDVCEGADQERAWEGGRVAVADRPVAAVIGGFGTGKA